jgi:hypothetical protein
MSFNTIALCAEDAAFTRRATAAYAAEGTVQADNAYFQMRWAVCSDPSVSGAYEYAVNAGNPEPGGDETAITDAMLTAAVQANPWPPTP